MNITTEDIYTVTLTNRKQCKFVMSELVDYLRLDLETIMTSQIKERDYTELNELFKELDVEKVDIMGFTTLLRVTSMYKHKIPEWNNFLCKAIEEAKKRDVDYETVFAGLY